MTPLARFSRLLGAVAASVVVAACGGGPRSLDQTGGPSRLFATRAELQDLLGRLEQRAPAAGSDSAELLANARERLASGDFRLDDRVLLTVEGEPTLSDTFAVDADRNVVLPGVGPVSLAGTLRSELQERMQQAVTRVIRQPVVRARPLVRIGVIGAVKTPGFHYVPADAPVSEPINAAGGYQPGASQDGMRVERAGHSVLAGDALKTALQSGQTIDRAGLQSGDEFRVPERGRMSAYEWVRLVSVILSIPLTIFALGQIF